MSNQTVIAVENLGKSYRISHLGQRQGYVALRDVITDAFRSLVRRRGQPDDSESSTEDFWALKDVSFDVKQGEVIGVIGRNGAGKSTLLKILSRITEPTRGRVHIKGRVASLLEVGTGFHPELTGRENVFLNGAILGMTRAEIKKKFDEIVAFADVEKFLDTPVKRYSSGMYVRLAFAVAAHLDPEILVVDEVLAVGDAVFQKKCLGKMQDVSRSQGRTVFFVSHNMGAIQSLCSRAILLGKGQVCFDGDPAEAISQYMQAVEPQSDLDTREGVTRQGTGEARILNIRLTDDDLNPRTHFRMGEALNVIVRVQFFSPVKNPHMGFSLLTDTGILVTECSSAFSHVKVDTATGTMEFHMRIEALPLYPRSYTIEPWVADGVATREIDWVRNAITFVVTSGDSNTYGTHFTSHHGISFLPSSCIIRSIDMNQAQGKQ